MEIRYLFERISISFKFKIFLNTTRILCTRNNNYNKNNSVLVLKHLLAFSFNLKYINKSVIICRVRNTFNCINYNNTFYYLTLEVK